MFVKLLKECNTQKRKCCYTEYDLQLPHSHNDIQFYNTSSYVILLNSCTHNTSQGNSPSCPHSNCTQRVLMFFLNAFAKRSDQYAVWEWVTKEELRQSCTWSERELRSALTNLNLCCGNTVLRYTVSQFHSFIQRSEWCLMGKRRIMHSWKKSNHVPPVATVKSNVCFLLKKYCLSSIVGVQYIVIFRGYSAFIKFFDEGLRFSSNEVLTKGRFSCPERTKKYMMV